MKVRFKEINLLFLIALLINIPIGNLLGRMTDIDVMLVQLLWQILLMAPYLIYLFITKQNVLQSIRLKKIRVANVFLLVIFAYAIYPFLGLLSSISMLFTKNVIGQRVMEMTEGKHYLISLVVLALVPCVFEEFVYRGVIYNEYKKAGVLKGMLLSSLLFGLMHRNLNQFIYTFVMALMLTLLMEATDSILAPMIVHFTINGSSVTVRYLLPILIKKLNNTLGDLGVNEEFFDINAINTSSEGLWSAIQAFGVMSVFSIVISALLLIGITKLEGRYDLLKQSTFWKKQTHSEKLLTLPLLISIVICITIIGIGFISAG